MRGQVFILDKKQEGSVRDGWMNSKTEDGKGQMTDVRGQRSEDRGKRKEKIGKRKAERADVRGQMSEIGGQEKAEDQKSRRLEDRTTRGQSSEITPVEHPHVPSSGATGQAGREPQKNALRQIKYAML